MSRPRATTLRRGSQRGACEQHWRARSMDGFGSAYVSISTLCLALALALARSPGFPPSLLQIPSHQPGLQPPACALQREGEALGSPPLSDQSPATS
jgi:hypothetical protein